MPYPPLWVIYHFVTRDTISGGVLGADQKITRKEALQVETINNAYLTFEERLKGSIEPGKLADLVVLPEDILTCAEKHIEQMHGLDDHGRRHSGVSQTVSDYVPSNAASGRSFFLINNLGLVPTLLKEPHCDPTLLFDRFALFLAFAVFSPRPSTRNRLLLPTHPAVQTPLAPADDDDAKLRPAEPDFVTINLPTTLPLPAHAMNFHLSHRFNEDLLNDSIGTQFSNLFGLDNGANIGLEFRYGVMKHLEAIVLRTSLEQDDSVLGEVRRLASDGDDAGRHLGDRVDRRREQLPQHRRRQPRELRSGDRRRGVADHRRTAGALRDADVGAQHRHRQPGNVRHRLHRHRRPRPDRRQAPIFVIEGAPRVGGLAIGDAEYAFAIEKRVGAHVFALTFSNCAGTTYRQIAHGGVPEHLTLGFNLTRKFY